jgi:general secretion pathway protein B
MSILLEALKKSEQQRQLGSAPDIHRGVDRPPGGDGGRGLQWLPISMMAAALVAMVWFGLDQYDWQAPEPVTVVGRPEVATAPPSGADASEKRDAGQSSRTPVESFAASTDRQGGTAASDAGSGTKQDELSQAVSQFKASPENTAGAEASDAADRLAETESPPEPAASARDPGAGSAYSRESETANFVSFWELPQNIRDSLPEIRISVLVFAEDPNDRFALVNGQRMVEKDRLDSNVVLDEIRREGAVFTYRKYRFLVKG